MKQYYQKARRIFVSLICMLLVINQLSVLTPAAEYGEGAESEVSESGFEETENEVLESSSEEAETEAFESSFEETEEQHIETETEVIETEGGSHEAAEAETVSSDAGISVETEEESTETEEVSETEEGKRAARYIRGPPAGSRTVLAFTSDIHNGSDNTAANRQDSWLSSVMEEYGHIDVLSFCGDMGDAHADESQFWSYTQSVENVVNSWNIPFVFTTGNHEFQNGKYSSTTNAIKSEYIVGDEAVYGDNFRIYCLGTENWNNNTDNYTTGQVAELRNYLSSVGNDRPIFVLTHFPLHFCKVSGGWYGSSGRKTANADLVIDALNDAADSGQTIILLWGHNHTVSDTHYDQIYEPGSTIEYKDGSSKEFRFYYGAAGCMSDSEYGTGSAFVKGKGLVVTIGGDNSLSFAYYDKNGNNISGSSGDTPSPEDGVIPENGGKYVILASDGYALTPDGTDVTFFNRSGNSYYNYFGLSGEEYTVGENVDPDHLLWTFTASEDGKGFYIQSQDGKYLNGTYATNSTGGYDGTLKLDDTPDVWILSGTSSGSSVNARILKSTNASQSNKGDKYLTHGNGSDSSVNVFSVRSQSSAISALFYAYEDDGTFIDPNEPVVEHTWDDGVVTSEPTCTKAGEKIFTCTTCGETKTEKIAALGHDWDEVVYTWASDDRTVTASHTCKNDPSHVSSETVSTTITETSATCDTPGSVTYKAVFKNIAFKKQTKTTEVAALGHNLQHHDAKAATCEAKGNIEYWTCDRCNKYFSDAEGKTEITQAQTVIAALGHNWKDPIYTWTSDNSKVTASRTCQNDASHVETETVNTTNTQTAATCLEAGSITYKATFRNTVFKTQTKTVPIAALGHDLQHHVAKAATCEAQGNIEYWTCDRCNKYFSDAEGETEITQAQTVIQAIGHDWGEPSYAWTADNSKVTASRSCKNDTSHTETETVNTTKTETPATCLEAGMATYNASFKNTAFRTQTKTVEIAALGHNLTHHDAKAAGCTTEGNIEYWSCDRCNKLFSDAAGKTEITQAQTVIAATGHDWGEVTYTWTSDNSKVTAKRTCKNDTTHVETETANTTKQEIPATCLEAGSVTYSVVFKNTAFKEQTKTVTVAALGHDWGEVTYTWTSDNSKVTAKHTCKNDASHVETETVSTTKQETPATCTEAGSITYSASFTNTAFQKQTKTVTVAALGHDWGEVTYTWSSDNSKVTASHTCKNDASHKETETVNTTKTNVSATCLEAGSVTYSAVFTNTAFAKQTKTVTVAALGHDWGEATYSWTSDNSKVTAKRICKNDPAHVETETVSTTKQEIPATCTEAGSITYSASFKNAAFAKQTKTVATPAIGHDWGEVTYTWTFDNSKVTAKRTCKNDPAHAETETVNTTKTETPATCLEAGSVTYNASFKNAAFAKQTKTVTVPALGHDWSEVTYTWTSDNSKVTAKRTCKNDLTHAETETVSTTKQETPATCTEAGLITYSASFKNAAFKKQTKTVEIDALGHSLKHHDKKTAACTAEGNIEYWSCERCGKLFSDAAGKTEITQAQTVLAALGHSWNDGETTKEATCTEKGVKTYTCTRCGESRTEEIAALGHNLKHHDKKAATCTAEGNIEYWSCERCGKLFRDAKGETESTQAEIVIAAIGHSYGEATYVWSDDNKTVTATAVCANDASHVVTETVKTSYQVTKEPAVEENGIGVYTAEFENGLFSMQTKEVELPAVIYKLSETSLTMATGTRKTLTVTDNYGRTADALWSCSDESVAAVSGGELTALRYGKAVITAAIGDWSENCEVSTLFYDVVKASDYYYKPVYWAADEGVTKGYDGVYFGVGRNCTRREVMIFLWRMSGCPVTDKDGNAYGDARNMFNDMKNYGPDSDTNKAIAWASAEGIAKGYSDGGYHPTATIVRKDVMIMLYRLAGKPEVSGTLTWPDCKKYKPASDTYKAILWGSENKITNGYTSGQYAGQFGAEVNCLREQIVTFMYRYHNLSH